MKKNIVLIILMTIIFLVTACSKQDIPQIENPQSVVENYFTSMNEKNVDEHLKTLSEDEKRNQGKINFDKIEYINIISIDEEMDTKFKEGYLKNGQGEGKGISEENLKVYKVKYDVKYKEGTITARDSGIYEEWYWVIRENSNSPWVIDDAGV
ncbi:MULTISPECIES: DUF4829 domain-containing protein [Clostridium]|nr:MULTISPECIES: DUF4829 domain-containing protein [Clostridium]MDU1347802.1 DUF4829 domain-containing protein [Clostridium argentinense]